MKKKFTTFLIVFLFFMPSFTYAQSITSSESPTPEARGRDQAKQKKEEIQNDKITNLKQRANTEIDRRVTSLQNLITKINSLKRISEEQRTSLTTQVQSEITELTNLKTKIEVDTDLATLRTDVKSIVNSYRIYALFIPKIHILAAADAILETSDKSTELMNKLQLRVDKAKTDGKDITSIETYLTDMQAKIEDAKKQAQNAIDTVTPLTPDGFPGNKTTLQSARKMIQTGRQDLHAARLDARKIIDILKIQKSPTDANISTTSTIPEPQ